MTTAIALDSSDTRAVCAAMVKAQAEFPGIRKSGENQAQRYRYADLEDYLVAVRKILAKYELALTFSVAGARTLADRPTRNQGVMYAVRVRVIARLIHGPTGQMLCAEAYGDGQDSGDKAVYKAITGARKYAVASLLGLATTDDPEKDEEQPKPQPKRQEKPASKPKTEDGDSPATDDQRKKMREIAALPQLPRDARERLIEAADRPGLTQDKARAGIEWAARMLREAEAAA